MNSEDLRDRIIYEYMKAEKENYGPEKRFQAIQTHSRVPQSRFSVTYPYSESKVVCEVMDKRYENKIAK